MKRRAQTRMSAEALAKVLHLREGIAVTDVVFNRETETVCVYLEAPEFPEVPKRDTTRCYSLADLMADFT